jgi:hypothetical protein
VNSTRIIANSIINREIDIAVVGGEIWWFKKNSEHWRFCLWWTKFNNFKITPFAKKKKINKEDLYCLDFITLNSNSTIKKFIDNILIQNQIETQQLKTILQLNSIEGIKLRLVLV